MLALFLQPGTSVARRAPLLAGGCLAAILTTLSGCGTSSPDPAPAATGRPAAETGPETTSGRDVWDVVLIAKERAGYVHTKVEPAKYDGQPAEKTTLEHHVAVQRFGQATTQDIRCESFESPDGRQLAFTTEIRMASSPQIIRGKVSGGKLHLEVTTEGRTEKKTLPWEDKYRGGNEPAASLLRKPMQPGEKREMTVLDFLTAGPVTTRLSAGDYEPVELPSGTVQLLRIDTKTEYPGGQALSATMWCDRSGDCLVTQFDVLGMKVVRSSRAQALQQTEPPKLDLGWDIAVKPDKPIPNAHQAKKITYRVRLKRGDPAAIFPSTSSQQVRSLDPHTAEITVYAVRPDQSGNPDAPRDPPVAADRKPNNNIQSDDPQVVARAKEAAGDQKEPWAVAVALERYVKKVMVNKNFSTAFATAAEVARKPEGDCTEHAVLLTALARACGLPARGVMGLVYVPHSNTFAFHMWSEVYLNNRWIPLDATLGMGGIGAGHLEIAHGSLEGSSLFTCALPVLDVLGQLSIEVERVEP